MLVVNGDDLLGDKLLVDNFLLVNGDNLQCVFFWDEV